MKLTDVLLDLLYPPKCPFCGRVLDHGERGLCARCQPGLPWTEAEEGDKAVDGCDACLSPLWYRDPVPEAVHRYKFGGGQNHAVAMGEWMAQCLSDRWSGPVDLITWVPLSPKRLRERGYDQARLLAERVGAVLDLPVSAALEKVRETQTQSHLEDEADRRANVRDVYRLLPGAEVSGKRLVLVDDVATTGATLAECAACLRAAGAASIVALTLARARK